MKNIRYSSEILSKLAEAMGSVLEQDNKCYTSRFQLFSDDPKRRAKQIAEGKGYVISQRKSDLKWLCACPDHIFNRHQASYCKHLDRVELALTKILAEQNRPDQFIDWITEAAEAAAEAEAAEADFLKTGTAE